MNKEEYLDNRLEDQIKWYSEKSSINQKWFKRLKLIQIMLAASIPVFSLFNKELPYLHIIVGVIGALIVIITSILELYKFQENWIKYRTTSEQLKHEKYLFITQTQPFSSSNEKDNFNLLVARVESIISKENSLWSQLHSSQDKKTKIKK